MWEDAVVQARSVIGDAIRYRRNHPYLFFVFHKHMESEKRTSGQPMRAKWHRYWRNHYWGKTLATSEAKLCVEGEKVCK